MPTRLLEGAQTRPGDVDLPDDGLNLEGYLDDIRAGLMRQALDRTSGVQTQAAELLGMSFRSFRYYAKKMAVTTAGGRPAVRTAQPNLYCNAGCPHLRRFATRPENS